MLALEAYSVSLETLSEESEDKHFIDNLNSVLTQYCGVVSPVEEDLTYFLERLQEISKALSEIKSSDKKPKKGFGTAYVDYITDLPVDRVIMKMCGYDRKVAYNIYCVMDRDFSDALVKDFISGEIEKNTVLMEASMYGFGGKYKDDKSSADKGIDVNTQEGRAAMSQFGF